MIDLGNYSDAPRRTDLEMLYAALLILIREHHSLQSYLA